MEKINIKKLILRFLFLFAISVVVSLFFNGLELFSSWMRFFKSVTYGMLIGAAYWLTNGILGRYVGRRRRWRKNPGKESMVTLWAFIFSGAVLSLIIPYFYFKYVFNIPEENFWFNVIFNSFIAFTVDLILISYFYSRYLVKSLSESMQKEEKLERENLLARYETLKNQVNPHFLFNSLNTLSGIVEKNSKQAVDYIKKLSDTYRYVLEQKDKELIPVHEELEFVRDYVYLEKIRHGDAFVFRLDISPGKAGVAPLALQMLIENAIKHNVISDEFPLFIDLFEEDGYFIARNNLQKKKVIRKQRAVGLENLISRYEFLSDKKVRVEETNNHFLVKLPVIQLK